MENDHISHIEGILRELKETYPQMEGMLRRRELPTHPLQVDYDSGWDFMWDIDHVSGRGEFV